MNNNKTLREYLLTEKMNIPYVGEYTIADGILFIVNLVIFPAMFFQMQKTFIRKESGDFNPMFVLLQLFGGAPEGMVGSVIGKLSNNPQMFYIGIYAMFYNTFMLFFRFFGINGMIYPLFKS